MIQISLAPSLFSVLFKFDYFSIASFPFKTKEPRLF